LATTRFSGGVASSCPPNGRRGQRLFSFGSSLGTVRGGEDEGRTTLWPEGVEVGISAFGVVREGAKDRLFGTREKDRKRTGWRERRAKGRAVGRETIQREAV